MSESDEETCTVLPVGLSLMSTNHQFIYNNVNSNAKKNVRRNAVMTDILESQYLMTL